MIPLKCFILCFKGILFWKIWFLFPSHVSWGWLAVVPWRWTNSLSSILVISLNKHKIQFKYFMTVLFKSAPSLQESISFMLLFISVLCISYRFGDHVGSFNAIFPLSALPRVCDKVQRDFIHYLSQPLSAFTTKWYLIWGSLSCLYWPS